ncbi:MAG: hypothetical protein COB02_15865 [Candidatus Cloacimonadota bacterium]|nr:MAG: hypothetical protein COB02_15865 [Candidatus Cloacimonadota bacterium]
MLEKIYFELVSPLNKISPQSISNLVVSFFNNHIHLDDYVYNFGKKVKLKNLNNYLQKKTIKYFSIESKNLTISLNPLDSHKISQIIIKFTSKNFKTAIEEVQVFINNLPLISARLNNSEYEFWQNANDPLEYTTENKPYKHLKVRYDEMLDYTFIDTSENPGRRIIKVGYIEAVSPIMWIGDYFLNKESIKTSILNSYQHLFFKNICQINLSNKWFKEKNMEDIKIQNNMRSLLFNN